MYRPAKGLFFAICYPILALIGVPANLLGIVILSSGQCGLSQYITCYLVAVEISDSLVIITAVILNRIGRIYFQGSVLSTTPACALSNVLVCATRDVSVWLTVAFTIDRFVAICCQSLKTRYCTEKTALLVIGLVSALSCARNVPFYLNYQPLYILDGAPWFCSMKPIYYTSLIWQAFEWLDHFLTPFLPFFLILLLNALTVRYILAASRARRRLRDAEIQGDQEMVNRKRSIVLLFAISLSFLLLWATYLGHFLYVQITGEGYLTSLDFNHPDYILQETANMLQLVSSCNNVFIYAVAQSKFREELRKVLTSPFTTVTGCFKQLNHGKTPSR
ncbi:probable G-protein coupled receptor 139 [Carcharodon carcharias]|uniref:probable G-protein coupled receptor 139 n=1 Tax=Carcharodon carcharias TaxID=13397 RepID=UPI001B7F5792|nr:probable G-protein coupled receptor 139 [Carcharodon carcharias]